MAMAVASRIDRAIAKPFHETNELLHRFFVSDAAFFGAGKFGGAKNTGFRITARPGNKRCGSGGKKIDPIELVVLGVETNFAALYQIDADIAAVEIHVERSFKFAGVCAAARELAFTPAGQK